jgi:hypothetical protein
VGIEEKRAIGERKLESGIGSVLGTTGATTGPVWAVGPVGMTWLMRVIRLVGVIGPMGMVWLVGMVGIVRMVWLMRVVRIVRMVRLVGVAWLAGMIRMVGRLRSIGATELAVAVRVSRLARMFNFFRLRPIGMLVTFQFLVGIKTSLKSLSTFMFVERKWRTYP